MAAPTEIYIDPSIAADSGTGTIGDPYGDLQYALNTATQDGTSGNRFNIKAGTYEVVASALTYTGTYGNPGGGTPLIFQGYTSAAGDGGLGQIDFNGGSHSFCAADAYVVFVDLECKNGTGTFLDIAQTNQMAIRCTFHDTTGMAVNNGGRGIHYCTFYDCATGTDAGHVHFCRFYNGAVRDFTTCYNGSTHSHSYVTNNTFELDGASNAITVKNYYTIDNNSIYGGGSTGYGIQTQGSLSVTIRNNIITDFSGAGGIGLDGVSLTAEHGIFAGNSFWNNTTEYDAIDSYFASGNETLGSTPFTDGSTGDFTPLDVGSVIGGAFPAAIGSQTLNLNRGAVQSAAGGGGGLLRVGMSGGMNG